MATATTAPTATIDLDVSPAALARMSDEQVSYLWDIADDSNTTPDEWDALYDDMRRRSLID